ncbi:MAG: hypothetical protein D6E12_00345 [Desulfovibrio sp.]|nr:MAG: hypothetical protein D6E12_00345 [Desulfovibrio sp.]
MDFPATGRWSGLVCCCVLALVLLSGPPALGQDSFADDPWIIDVHDHILAGGRNQSLFDAAQAAVEAMDEAGVRTIVLMPPPLPTTDHPGAFSLEELKEVVAAHPGRLAFMAGGESLNPMIQEAVAQGEVSAELLARFEAKAREIAGSGALGFGELEAEHLCLGPDHHHQNAPPDHPLFLRLAEIAAETGLALDIHMEAVVQDMDLPEHLPDCNPARLPANIERFERLLDHAPDAVVIWDHVGWDNTGARDVELITRLLEAHPNLYMSFKISPRDCLAENMPVVVGQGVKPEWSELIARFPDRFLLGADQFFLPPRSRRSIGPESWTPTMKFFSKLDPDLARAVGRDNPARLFGL